MNNCYVYEWIRLDTNEPFYVGKGKLNRCYALRKRNKYFCDILYYCDKNSIEVAIHILDSNLSEIDALNTECWYINYYVFECGYKLTNQTWGGDGGDIVSLMSPEQKIAYSKKMSLSCLGKNKGHFHTDETKQKISTLNKGRLVGSKNPMYGKSATDFMTPSQILQWNKNKSLSMLGKKHTDETKLKIGAQVSRKVRGTLGEISFSFDSVLDCKTYFSELYNVSHRFVQNIINSNIPYKSTTAKTRPLNGLFLEKYKE
ncbi:MAG: NUMOD3 domain-containing DNA-binding protein [Clostridium sp.]